MAEKLKFEPAPELPYIQIALVTSEPVYRICWLLNELFHISFAENEPITCMHPKRQMLQSYILFEAEEESRKLNFFLIQNKGQQGVFDEDQKQVDFWLRIEGTTNANEFLGQLKAIKEINLAFEVKPGLLKTKSRLHLSMSNLKNQGLSQV